MFFVFLFHESWFSTGFFTKARTLSWGGRATGFEQPCLKNYRRTVAICGSWGNIFARRFLFQGFLTSLRVNVYKIVQAIIISFSCLDHVTTFILQTGGCSCAAKKVERIC